MKMRVTGGTEAKDPDSDRENQDAIYFSLQEDDTAALLIVADGVGGHHDGGLASKTVVEMMSRELADIFIAVPIDENSALEFLQDQLRFAVYRTHEKISAYAHKKGQRLPALSLVR
jgi:serine/threonine protein phosphatase PrpC